MIILSTTLSILRHESRRCRQRHTLRVELILITTVAAQLACVRTNIVSTIALAIGRNSSWLWTWIWTWRFRYTLRIGGVLVLTVEAELAIMGTDVAYTIALAASRDGFLLTAGWADLG